MKSKLVNYNEIEINHCEEAHYDFFINDKLIPTRLEGNRLFFDFEGEVLGNKLELSVNDERSVVSVLEMPKRSDFDEHYAYLNDDLGPTYQKDKTIFKLWAPLACHVVLRILSKEFDTVRKDKGVYELTINGDLDGELYDFVITLDGKEIVSVDPYAKSANANNDKSAVIDLNKIATKITYGKESNYVDAIIYEGHVRDLTINPNTDIKNKGKYLGLTESNKTSKNGNPVGIDYLASLGITHLQLLPVLDYATVDENNDNDYNWGYDPIHFFTLEGSYSTNPNDPYSRIVEFKKMIDALHSKNIKVNLDVVYNHVYKPELFSLSKITPNYFFRIEDERLADHSWCGNDFQSERAMARKAIVDSVLYLLKTFDVDGFRFDLMGLLDVDTINEITTKVKKYKSFAMIYGEGWDMFAVSNYGAKFANYKNASLLPGVAFFNDSYRNTAKGTGSKARLEKEGFLFSNNEFADGFKYAYLGSRSDYPFPHLFTNLNQSINYVECHDNATIFDVISNTNTGNKLEKLSFINKVLLLSPGIPFIHMGQEFGQSKNNESNTYNSGDELNQFDSDLMDERISLVNEFKENVKLRKSIKSFNNPNLNSIEFEDDEDTLKIKIEDKHLSINSINNKCDLIR